MGDRKLNHHRVKSRTENQEAKNNVPLDHGQRVTIYCTMKRLCLRKLKPNGHPLYTYIVTLLKGNQQECSSQFGVFNKSFQRTK